MFQASFAKERHLHLYAIATSTLDTLRRRHGSDLLAIAIVFIVYTLTLWSAYTYQISLVSALRGGASNTLPVVICGLAARRIIIRGLIGRGLVVQAIGHTILCALFSLTAYWILIVLLSATSSSSPWNFVVKNFVVRGMSWQLLENVTTYGVLAALTYARAYSGAAKSAVDSVSVGTVATPAPSPKEPSRYLVRIGDELRPINVDRKSVV